MAEAVGRTANAPNQDREALIAELGTALRGHGPVDATAAPELRRLAHIKCVSHASSSDVDVEWRVELAPPGGVAPGSMAPGGEAAPAHGMRFRGRHEKRATSDGAAEKRCLHFEAREGDAVVIEPSRKRAGQRALRAANGVEVMLFACIAAVEARVTEALHRHKASGDDLLWML